MELTDVDGDGAAEIFVVFPHIRRPFEQTYIFKFAAGKLTLLSPLICREVAPGFESTDLLFVETVDLDGDKVLELIDRREQRIDALSTAEEEALIERVQLWKLDTGKYRRLGEAVFFDRYRRDSGGPEAIPGEFYAEAGPADLIVINGAERASRVSSAVVDLNGSVVVTADKLNQNVARVEVPVTLKQSNVLTVKLAGKPDAGVFVYILPRGGSEKPCGD